MAARSFDDVADALEQGAPFQAEAVEGAGLDQAFQNALVDLAQVDAGDEIVEVLEFAALARGP